jgi:integrase
MPPELLAALRKIEERGYHETAHRAKQKSGQVFRYAILTGRAERDIRPLATAQRTFGIERRCLRFLITDPSVKKSPR